MVEADIKFSNKRLFGQILEK